MSAIIKKDLEYWVKKALTQTKEEFKRNYKTSSYTSEQLGEFHDEIFQIDNKLENIDNTFLAKNSTYKELNNFINSVKLCSSSKFFLSEQKNSCFTEEQLLEFYEVIRNNFDFP